MFIPPARRWSTGAAVLIGISLAIVGCSSDDQGASTASSSSTVDSSTTVDEGSTPTSTTTRRPSTTTTTDDLGTVLKVQVIEPHRARYQGGKLYLEGAVPSRRIANAFKGRATEVIGADNVIDNYVIDPAAPVPTDGRVVVDEPLIFPTGSAVLDPAYYSIADLGVAVMKLNPAVVMRIFGYTDAVGSDEDNLILSQARANAVVDYIAARGVDRSRFRATGRGESDPAASNDTAIGRQANRRIEVELVNLLG